MRSEAEKALETQPDMQCEGFESSRVRVMNLAQTMKVG